MERVCQPCHNNSQDSSLIWPSEKKNQREKKETGVADEGRRVAASKNGGMGVVGTCLYTRRRCCCHGSGEKKGGGGAALSFYGLFKVPNYLVEGRFIKLWMDVHQAVERREGRAQQKENYEYMCVKPNAESSKTIVVDA